jgi:hypothetical protein
MPAEERKPGPRPHVTKDMRDGTLDMPAEAPKAGPRPDVPEDMRDIAATALWICLLESPSPVRGRMPPQICVISPPRHSGYACWKAQVRCEARMSPQMRDVAATALWICLLESPSPVRGRMSRQIYARYRRHGTLDMPAEEPKPGPGPHVISDMSDITATALWICLFNCPMLGPRPDVT